MRACPKTALRKESMPKVKHHKGRYTAEDLSFDSMAGAATAIGISKSVLTWCKSNGCPAFKSNRVYVLPLVRWIFSDGDRSTDWGKVSEEMGARMKHLEYDREIGNVVAREEVQRVLKAVCGVLFGALKRMTIEDPANLEQRDKGYIKQERQRQYEKTLARCEGEIQQLMAEVPSQNLRRLYPDDK